MKFSHVPQVMRYLHERGYLLAVMSNESIARLKKDDAISRAFVRKCGRMQAWGEAIGVPVIGMCAISGSSADPGRFRKPSIGMWTWLEEATAHAAPLDKSRSFYVGDAAGRPGGRADASAGGRGDGASRGGGRHGHPPSVPS